MRMKNEKQHTIGNQLAIRAGCSLVLLPITLIVGGIMVWLAIAFFNLYFFGNSGASVKPFQDPTYLLGLGLIVPVMIMLLRTTFRYIKPVWSDFQRYRGLRREQSRVERLMDNDNIAEPASLESLNDRQQSQQRRE